HQNTPCAPDAPESPCPCGNPRAEYGRISGIKRVRQGERGNGRREQGLSRNVENYVARSRNCVGGCTEQYLSRGVGFPHSVHLVGLGIGMDFIQVDIIGLSTSPSSGGAYALVLGEVNGNRRLPIIIGA